MSFKPHYIYARVSEIPVEKLQSKGIKGVILDVDNTLTTHDAPQPSPWVRNWLDQLEQAGIKTMILSNNNKGRVLPFAEILKLPFVAEGKKPLTIGYEKCAKLMGCAPNQLAMVGDQLFTDIWGGNRFGCMTILVEPIQEETMFFFKAKRFVEKIVLKDMPRRQL